MLAVDVLDAPEAARRDRGLLRALGDGGRGTADAVLGRDAERGGRGEGPGQPGDEAGHGGGHCCRHGEEGDYEGDEGLWLEGRALAGF